jgi:hypothetical protein
MNLNGINNYWEIIQTLIFRRLEFSQDGDASENRPGAVHPAI